MQQIKAFIVDDELRSIRVLTKLLNMYCPEVLVIGSADSAASAHEKIISNEPDLLFLDVEMPLENGFDLLDRLSPFSFEVVFLTAFDQYAIKAIKYNAFDYLLKPLDIDALKECMQKLKTKLKATHQSGKNEELISKIIDTSVKPTRVGFPTLNGLVFLQISDIVRCEANGSYTKIYLSGKKNILVSKSLKHIEQMLPESLFYRIHHSNLINMNFIKSYTKGRGGNVEMMDGAIIEVSARRKEGFLARFK